MLHFKSLILIRNISFLFKNFKYNQTETGESEQKPIFLRTVNKQTKQKTKNVWFTSTRVCFHLL